MFSDTVNKTVGDVSILKYFFHIKIFLRWQSVTAMMMDSSVLLGGFTAGWC